ncbi:MAG: 4-(cytidine 5'-diphospho)-2-C-methyl-D-erythritol kinase [Candidatus Omnitrophota bacterium]
MDEVLTLKSPAKINLYLKVLRKRPDGFHDIETIFERIDLCDEIRLKPIKDEISILCDNSKVPTDARNLAYKAAKLLKEKYSPKAGAEITINKRIPVAAGLGGASSNCATCLCGLNTVWNLGLRKDELLRLAAQLGADVSFFILDVGRAVGRDKGGILEGLPKSESFWYLLVNPGFGVLAKEAYSALNLGLTHKSNNSKIDLKSFRKIRFGDLKEFLFNSLEGPIEKRFKEIHEVKSAILKAGLKTSLMSGSGPTVFGIASSQEEVLGAKKRLSLKEGWQAFVATTYW